MTRQVVEDGVAERYQLEVPDDPPRLPPARRRSPRSRTRGSTELRELIERMGTDINLTAIDEFAEVSQRFEFLSAQKTDLERAVDQLQRAIDKINKTSPQAVQGHVRRGQRDVQGSVPAAVPRRPGRAVARRA